MSKEIIANSLNRNFESLKKVDENGVEYWEARELMLILGYKKWEKAEEVVARAARACINSGQAVDNHFHRMGKMVYIGSNTVREVRDWKLDRYACYLIAQNGDPKKPEIAMAQTYFAIQTRRQENTDKDNNSQEKIRNGTGSYNSSPLGKSLMRERSLHIDPLNFLLGIFTHHFDISPQGDDVDHIARPVMYPRIDRWSEAQRETFHRDPQTFRGYKVSPFMHDD